MLDQEYFEEERLLNYVEAWFDNHPEPENIDCHTFGIDNECMSQGGKVHIYFADMIHNNFMIKIESHTARRALYLSKLFYKTTCQMGITQILKNKNLFLFTDTRF